jgi:hypothetical protein
MHPIHDDGELPDALKGAFTRLRAPSVPPEVENAVLAHAVDHFARLRRRRWTITVGTSFAAASVLAVAFIAFRPRQERTGTETARIEDIDGSGRVDILDAFALARSIAHGARPDPRLDFTHDGRIDRADVDHVAQMAVRLGS